MRASTVLKHLHIEQVAQSKPVRVVTELFQKIFSHLKTIVFKTIVFEVLRALTQRISSASGQSGGRSSGGTADEYRVLKKMSKEVVITRRMVVRALPSNFGGTVMSLTCHLQ